MILGYIFIFFFALANAVNVPFTSCLSSAIYNFENATYFSPYIVDVSYSKTEELVTVLVYGVVTGEIVDQHGDYLTSLETYVRILDWTQVNNFARFCGTIQGSCPLSSLSSGSTSSALIETSFPLDSSSQLADIDVIIRIISPSSATLGCVEFNFSQAFSSPVSNVFRYIPLTILLCLGAITTFAAMYNPWTGSTNFFFFTTNFGQDPDALRLQTPTFTDCLQYIQFVVLSSALSLNYPTFIQPIASKFAWALGLFDISFVSHKTSSTFSIVKDNIYAPTPFNLYPLEKLGQYTGLATASDVWTSFVVWILVLYAIILVISQLGFVLRYAWVKFASNGQRDLRQKYWQTIGGLTLRLFLNLFSLPLVTFCCWQFFIATVTDDANPVVTAFAAIVFILYLALFGSALFWILTTRLHPSLLFSDLSTLLLVGPLYNTATERGVLCSSIAPTVVTILRGIAFGALQASGIAQIVVLALVELSYASAIYIFRPYHPTTSMNAYYFVLSCFRFLVIMFSIAFIPSLETSSPIRGWIGYLILLLHGIVLIFIFSTQALATLIETILRLFGYGDDRAAFKWLFTNPAYANSVSSNNSSSSFFKKGLKLSSVSKEYSSIYSSAASSTGPYSDSNSHVGSVSEYSHPSYTSGPGSSFNKSRFSSTLSSNLPMLLPYRDENYDFGLSDLAFSAQDDMQNMNLGNDPSKNNDAKSGQFNTKDGSYPPYDRYTGNAARVLSNHEEGAGYYRAPRKIRHKKQSQSSDLKATELRDPQSKHARRTTYKKNSHSTNQSKNISSPTSSAATSFSRASSMSSATSSSTSSLSRATSFSQSSSSFPRRNTSASSRSADSLASSTITESSVSTTTNPTVANAMVARAIVPKRHVRMDLATPESNSHKRSSSNVDYAVREADVYFTRRRNQPLSDSIPSRRFHTGPVDPTGKSSAWLQKQQLSHMQSSNDNMQACNSMDGSGIDESGGGVRNSLSGGITRAVSGILGKFMKPISNNSQPRGFEVVRSRPMLETEVQRGEITELKPVGRPTSDQINNFGNGNQNGNSNSIIQDRNSASFRGVTNGFEHRPANMRKSFASNLNDIKSVSSSPSPVNVLGVRNHPPSQSARTTRETLNPFVFSESEDFDEVSLQSAQSHISDSSNADESSESNNNSYSYIQRENEDSSWKNDNVDDFEDHDESEYANNSAGGDHSRNNQPYYFDRNTEVYGFVGALPNEDEADNDGDNSRFIPEIGHVASARVADSIHNSSHSLVPEHIARIVTEEYDEYHE